MCPDYSLLRWKDITRRVWWRNHGMQFLTKEKPAEIVHTSRHITHSPCCARGEEYGFWIRTATGNRFSGVMWVCDERWFRPDMMSHVLAVFTFRTLERSSPGKCCRWIKWWMKLRVVVKFWEIAENCWICSSPQYEFEVWSLRSEKRRQKYEVCSIKCEVWNVWKNRTKYRVF